MKSLLILPVLAVVFSVVSCRTVTPIEPMTGKQCSKCLPENFSQDNSCGERSSK